MSLLVCLECTVMGSLICISFYFHFRLFIATLVTALIDIIIVVVFAIFVFTAIFEDKNDGDLLKPYHGMFLL